MADMESPNLGSIGVETPESSAPTIESSSNGSVSKPNTKPLASSPPAPAVPTFPPPKTDKPRPHVCTTCMRSFARLEHLKRHERSHTKEKPFECPHCARCFARRDLLLRHQQKLHSTTTPSSRPRAGRRESTTGVANGRVRKNSVASTTNATSMRPRANTLSHIDSSALSNLTDGVVGRHYAPMHSHHSSFNGISSHSGFGLRNMGSMNNPASNGLLRIETSGLPLNMSGGLRTAPPYGGFGAEFDMGGLGFDHNGGNTINPHALHMHNLSGFPMDNSWDSSQHMYSGMPTSQSIAEDDGFDWMSHGFENQMSFAQANENAIDDSSPSAMSTNSPATFQDMTNNANNNFADSTMSTSVWQQPTTNGVPMVNSPMSMDVNGFLGDMAPPGDTISPKSLLAQRSSTFEHSFPTPPDLTSVDPASLASYANGGFTLPYKQENIASTASTASVDSSLRHSSVTTQSSELVNDHMRNVLMAGLNQSAGFGQRKQSQPAVSSPLSPTGGTKHKPFNAATFPSTQELQRYVSAYIKYFHPHLPFLHVPTLNFELIDYATNKVSGGYMRYSPAGAASGGSCLVLSVAAMGALYENEVAHSRELFECAKRLISNYLEDRRRSNVGKAQLFPQRPDREDTPMWLVQAMLLNVIYGHNCGDKQAADIASNHCAALVSLARGAELAKPYPTYLNVHGGATISDGLNIQHMQGNGATPDSWNMLSTDAGENDWYEWKVMEERKRTLYAVFILSSMLVTAYNRAPALTNSEIRLDLPCDEELWTAESAQAWRACGGVALAETRSVQFASALTHLLTAAQRQRHATSHQTAGDWQIEEDQLRPSSFGCLVLVNALHNYIWETRQRHLGRQWTVQELESMHSHIEPALRAWQKAWHSNPTHAVERPNPFGAGPLSADSIPLLDLAYVRLFVDFGRSKEAYWQRDYDAMAKELAKGSEDNTSHTTSAMTHQDISSIQDLKAPVEPGLQIHVLDNLQDPGKEAGQDAGAQATQRERHVRKAAFYAADHLLASDRLGLGLDENNARELPIQSVLCACDSAQVLAEWVATIQERVGKFIGILGRDDIDLTQVPATVLLDEQDRKLLKMINDLLVSVESKCTPGASLLEAREGGYGSRVLISTSQTMARAAVWPVTKLMARSLETQSGHVKARALASVST